MTFVMATINECKECNYSIVILELKIETIFLTGFSRQPWQHINCSGDIYGTLLILKFFNFYSFLRFYLFILRERERTQAGRVTEGEGEAGSSRSTVPHVGIFPRTLGS